MFEEEAILVETVIFIDWCWYLVLKSIEDRRAMIEDFFCVWKGKKPSI